MMMRIVGALYWAIIGTIFGAIDGAALYWAVGWNMVQGALIGAVLAGATGLIAGLFRPKPKNSLWAGRDELRYGFRPCAWCKGSGRVGKRARQPCSVCYGRGSVLTQQPARACPTCKGKGKASFGRKCKVCYGAGWEIYGYLEDVVMPPQNRKKSKAAL